MNANKSESFKHKTSGNGELLYDYVIINSCNKAFKIGKLKAKKLL